MPVGELLGRTPRPSRWATGWRALVRWRDWSLPVKLSAVTLVPILIALALGIATIASQVGRSDGYQRLDRLVALSGQIRTLADGLGRERTQSAAGLTAGTVGGTLELASARGDVDTAIPLYRAAATRAVETEPSLARAKDAAAEQLDKLADIRQRASAGQLDPVQAIGEYTDVTTALLAVDTALAAGASEDALGGTPAALHDLAVMKEQLSLSQALVSFGIARSGLAPSELNQVRTAELRLADRFTDFRAAASEQQRQEFAAVVSDDAMETRDRLAKTALGDQGTPAGQAFRKLSAQAWTDASNSMLTKVGEVANKFGARANAVSAELVDDASSGAGLLAVLLFGAMVLAVAVVFLITRQLLRSLKVLRASALDVAEKQLPDAVRNIQEGRSQGTDVQPVPVGSDDEIGEVARAFDKVHHQALRLATEQASMRAGYSNVFVNLSRRSQSLVQRQLQLIERLERDEEDADQLATLFQLDHLATRMRRNNENLMVLSGAEPGRRSGQPVSASDVVRAAVSEIEQYQRVTVQNPPPVRLVGYAANDLMRLIAELLDNATAFSAPETQVTVATRLLEDGSFGIDILDKGIGMNEAEVAEANARLTEAPNVDLTTSRRMGLFVVGRLASRHRIGVSLHGGKDIVGVRATVSVPADLVMVPAGDPGPATGPITQRLAPLQPGGLPRRQRPANGSRPAMPSVPSQGGDRWPSASDLAGHTKSGLNGHTQEPRPPSDVEISGTALFSPIPKDETTPPPAQPPSAPESRLPEPEPAAEPEPVAKEAEKPAEPQKAAPEGELPSGKELFEAKNGTTLSEWWSQAAPPAAPVVPPPTASETTPIFDEMLSAWFRSPAPAPEKSAAEPADKKEKQEKKEPAEKKVAEPAAEAGSAAEQEARNWDFASDKAFRTVQEVSQTAPSTFTQAGLPRRRKGEQLLPGSAMSSVPAAEPTAKSELPVRDPANVRGRLSSFQQGVKRGRKEAAGKAAPATTQLPAPETAVTPEPAKAPEASETAKAAETAARPATPPATLPTRRPEKNTQAATPEAEPATAVERTDAWNFGSDEGWKAAQAVSQSVPSKMTSAGLPRRRRGEQLLPGSAGPPAGAVTPRPQRDAHDVRGRLSSFQQGIQRGRHRTAQATEANHETLEGE
ncbi:sensor histidine kinase [Amycolatopsis regifaucium]|uniref:histidine kinase n=1 Tax=Amycolatopsis regifaucium TaxID=546365 RepID=A0A154MJE8_9PSEU|nr:nitrate- and nitrite sensing domain-containing protein [Amycolatopsis regifaucium]KZB84481.1 histidine kinase [Amycolatopsis regifaucium]OKA10943.1 histidine kinase [Amycolatopsis regifaucium]SFI22896.1 Signal transduction histidine kinase [Amycolatopsis regifaucium]